MTTATAVRPRLQDLLETAVHDFERHQNLPDGHYRTSASADEHDTHLHLRAVRPGRDLGSTFEGIAVPGLDATARIVLVEHCPICRELPVPAPTLTVEYRTDTPAAAPVPAYTAGNGAPADPGHRGDTLLWLRTEVIAAAKMSVFGDAYRAQILTRTICDTATAADRGTLVDIVLDIRYALGAGNALYATSAWHTLETAAGLNPAEIGDAR